MRQNLLLIGLVVFGNFSIFANAINDVDLTVQTRVIMGGRSGSSANTPIDLPFNDINLLLRKDSVQDVAPSLIKRKIIAVTLAVTLGVFGVHRLYLGTSTKVPIIYTLTLGGGFGVLVVSDIIAIIVAKDLSQFESEPKVFMWAK